MISQAYAMASPPGREGQPPPGIGSFLMPIGVFLAILYFLVLRPEKKKALQQRKFLEALKKGDEVVTQGGIYGRVANINDQVITLEIADKVKIRVTRSSISGISSPASGGSEASPSSSKVA
jgi:preprotein translocase subunit YajC